LKPNYPNPFNPVTTIQFDIPAETQHAVSLQVYDISGRMIETLVNEKLKPGQHQTQWNASDHSSGLYFLKMERGHYIKTQKMILLK
jgi:flagellar hook assembly protein FlgD